MTNHTKTITTIRLIRWYKGHITFKSRKINPDFAWQPRFHDHIVRDEFELERVRLYIKQNPEKWQFDQENRNPANRVCEPDGTIYLLHKSM